jgi:hypothetical protein
VPPQGTLDDDTHAAKLERRRRTSALAQEGQTGVAPERTSSSNPVWHWLQQNS